MVLIQMAEARIYIGNLDNFIEELYAQEKYTAQLEMIKTGITGAFVLDMNDLPQEYYNNLVSNYYGDTKKEFENQLSIDCKGVSIVIKNLPVTKKIRELDSNDISRINTINGIIISCKSPRSIARELCFVCPSCNDKQKIEQTFHNIIYPTICHCGNDKKFMILENESIYDDYQELTIQENPDDTEIGVIPRIMEIILVGKHLVDKCKPGDVINLTGILSVEQEKGTRVFNWFIIGNYIEILNKDAFSVELSDEDKAELERWAADERIRSIILKSIYPSIYGLEEEKYGLTLSLFGGVEHKKRDINFRGSSNCLLLGDPSTAKTAMLQAAMKAAPKALYTQAGGSSGVGLTASMIKDGDVWTIAAGAVVLANGGICCIDELEKMSKEDRDKLHECMEIQTVSINKADKHVTLNAKTAILAAANPKLGRYDENLTVAENIDLPPTILSRFDLIYIMRDIPEPDKDKGIVDRIFDTLDNKEDETLPMMSTELLKKYILYAKSIKPVITEEARKRLMATYLGLRGRITSDRPIPIATRQLQGMIRLTQAHARMALKHEADITDAEMAIQLVMNTLTRASIDPTTGEVDTCVVETGTSNVQAKKRDSKRVKREMMIHAINKYIGDFSEETVFNNVGEHFDDPEEFHSVFKQFVDNKKNGINEVEIGKGIYHSIGQSRLG